MTEDDHTLRRASESQRTILHRRQSRGRRYAKATLLLLAAVLAGVAIGVGGTLLYMRGKFHRRPPSPEAVADMVIERMRTEVPLNPDEERRIHSVIDDHMREVDRLRRDNFDAFRSVIDRMGDQVDAVLGPDRAQTWDRAKEKHFGKRKHPPKHREKRH